MKNAASKEIEPRLTAMRREIGAVDRAAEEAAVIMLGCAEQVLQLCRTLRSPAAAAIREQMLILMSACSFRDLTGQRLSNLLASLAAMERRLAAGETGAASPMKETAVQKRERLRKEKLLLHGPQQAGEGLSQEAIDLLFG